MSYLKTKQALVERLLTSVDAGSVAFENRKFNPAGKSTWYACYFMPATTEIMGKTGESSDEQRGIFQVSVFVNKNNDDYDNDQLTAIDSILDSFVYNESIDYSGQVVQVLSSTVNDGAENEAWFRRDISINYLTFTARGGTTPASSVSFLFQNDENYVFQDGTSYVFN